MDFSSFMSAMTAAQAMSSCFTESPSSFKAENGTMITYCNYKGDKKFPGDKWTSKECEKCTCTADEGLKCCKAGQHHVSYTNVNGDSECVQKKEGCEIKWVYRNDQNKACPESKIPKPDKMPKTTPAAPGDPLAGIDEDKLFNFKTSALDHDGWDHDFDDDFHSFEDDDDDFFGSHDNDEFFGSHDDDSHGFDDDDFWKHW